MVPTIDPVNSPSDSVDTFPTVTVVGVSPGEDVKADAGIGARLDAPDVAAWAAGVPPMAPAEATSSETTNVEQRCRQLPVGLDVMRIPLVLPH